MVNDVKDGGDFMVHIPPSSKLVHTEKHSIISFDLKIILDGLRVVEVSFTYANMHNSSISSHLDNPCLMFSLFTPDAEDSCDLFNYLNILLKALDTKNLSIEKNKYTIDILLSVLNDIEHPVNFKKFPDIKALYEKLLHVLKYCMCTSIKFLYVEISMVLICL